MRSERVLVTGANGFVGASIVRALASVGTPVVALVRTGRTVDARSVEIREISEWSRESLSGAFEGVGCVVHAASVVHRPDASLSEYEQFNIDGTEALLSACRERNVHRLVHVSTIKVYGERPPGIIDEETPLGPEGGYASSKVAAERLVLDAASRGGPSAVVLRLCPVFGPGDKGNVRTMIRAIARRRFLLPGDGSTRKSIVHVSTVADVARAAAMGSVTGTLVVADRRAPSMRELANAIAGELHRPAPRSVPISLLRPAAHFVEVACATLGHRPPITRDLIDKSLIPTVCSPARAERELGITCHVDLQPAIREEIGWLRTAGLL